MPQLPLSPTPMVDSNPPSLKVTQVIVDNMCEVTGSGGEPVQSNMNRERTCVK